MQDELDKNLQTLFQEKIQSLPVEPFLSIVLKRIERQRSRQVILQMLLPVLGLACCALLSPFLIKGSVLLSNGLNFIFETAGAFSSRPAGLATAAVSALLFIILKPRRIFRFD